MGKNIFVYRVWKKKKLQNKNYLVQRVRFYCNRIYFENIPNTFCARFIGNVKTFRKNLEVFLNFLESSWENFFLNAIYRTFTMDLCSICYFSSSFSTRNHNCGYTERLYSLYIHCKTFVLFKIIDHPNFILFSSVFLLYQRI